MIQLFKVKLLLQALLTLCHLATVAQINLSPTFLMIDDKSGISELYVHNGSESRQEVSIRFVFGYPSADTEGRTIMVYNDSLKEEKYGLNQHIRVFPQRFIIDPAQTQTVILQVRPLNQKDDGMYFTRLVVSSNMVSTDIDKQSEDGINMQINYVLNQNIPVMYRKGNVQTGLAFRHIDTKFYHDRLVIVKQLTPTGNAPFNGSVTAILSNSANEVVATQQQTVVAYFDVMRKLSMPLPKDRPPRGDYFLRLIYETKRRDISPDQLVQAPEVIREIRIQFE